eukprot:jgi/Mesvir1/24327/Mv11009-RA.1
MAKVSPGSRIINVEEHAGEDGRTYYMSRWTVDPVVPCIVCKKDRPHKSAGHGPRVCEYSDGRVTYLCWKKGPKHAECIMDRREFVAESVPFGETYCTEKIKPFDVDGLVEDYIALKDRCDAGEILTAFEKKLKNIYELAEFSYQIPRECRDEELAGLLEKDKCRTVYRAIRQHSRATELGRDKYLANVLEAMRRTHSIFDLSEYKTGRDSKTLAAAIHLLEGSGIEAFVLDRESARTVTIPRDKAIEIGNRIDSEIMEHQTFMRAVFGYRRRAKGGAGTLSFAQCASLLNNMLGSTLNISANGVQSNHKKDQDLEISKVDVLDFCQRFLDTGIRKQSKCVYPGRAYHRIG